MKTNVAGANCPRCGVVMTEDSLVLAGATTIGKKLYKAECKDCLRVQSSVARKLRIENPPPGDGYECPICFRVGMPLHMDHNHDTHEFRGYLCARCNKGLGFFLDNEELVQRALDYLTGKLETNYNQE